MYFHLHREKISCHGSGTQQNYCCDCQLTGFFLLPRRLLPSAQTEIGLCVLCLVHTSSGREAGAGCKIRAALFDTLSFSSLSHSLFHASYQFFHYKWIRFCRLLSFLDSPPLNQIRVNGAGWTLIHPHKAAQVESLPLRDIKGELQSNTFTIKELDSGMLVSLVGLLTACQKHLHKHRQLLSLLNIRKTHI